MRMVGRPGAMKNNLYPPRFLLGRMWQDKIKGLKMKEEKYIKLTTAAREKGVARAAVYFALAKNRIDMIEFDGVPFIIKNEKYRVWAPKSSDKK